MKQLFVSAMVVALTFVSLGTVSTPVAQAQTVRAQSNSSEPSVALTYNKKSGFFLLVTSNLQSASYTIEYERSIGGGREALEGPSGAGKGKKTSKGVVAYARSLYAGTQSSKYRIPHTVKSGTLILKGKKTDGSAFSYTKSFTVTNGRLVLGR